MDYQYVNLIYLTDNCAEMTFYDDGNDASMMVVNHLGRRQEGVDFPQWSAMNRLRNNVNSKTCFT